MNSSFFRFNQSSCVRANSFIHSGSSTSECSRRFQRRFESRSGQYASLCGAMEWSLWKSEKRNQGWWYKCQISSICYVFASSTLGIVGGLWKAIGKSKSRCLAHDSSHQEGTWPSSRNSIRSNFRPRGLATVLLAREGIILKQQTCRVMQGSKQLNIVQLIVLWCMDQLGVLLDPSQ